MKTITDGSPKLSRRRKILYWLGGAVVVYAILGYFVAPAVIKSQMLKRLPLMLKRPVAVADVKVNPFALSLTISGFAVNENDGSSFAGWDTMFAQLGASSFFHRGWSVTEISLAHPFARISREKDGRLNFDDILAALSGPAPHNGTFVPKPVLPLVKIDLLRIDGMDVAVDDYVPAKPVHTKIIPAHLTLNNLSTEPGARNPYVFTATSDTGESFQWSGAFTLDPPLVFGNFGIKQLDLKKYSPYVAPFAAAEITDGRLDVAANYTAGLGSNGLELSLSTAEIQLKSFSAKSTATGETVVSVPALSVSLAEADLGKKLIHVTAFSTSGGLLLVRQENDGKINLLAMLVTNPPAAAAPYPTVAVQAPWTAIVDDIDVENYALAVEDKKPAKPAKISVHEINFKAKGFSTAGNAPITADVALNLGESGRFTANGIVRLQPPSANLDLKLVGLDLRPYQPYVEQRAKLAITSGLLSLQGHAAYDSAKGATLATFAGDVGLTNFVTADLLHFKDFVKFDALAVNGIKFSFQPNQLDVQEIKLAGLSTSVMVDSNKQINLLTVLPQGAPAASNATPRPGPAGVGFPVTLGSFVFDNASFHLSDQSVEPNCLFDIQQFGGSVNGLSSQPDSRADVDVHGKVDEVSSFSVTGGANVLSTNMVVNVAVDCKNVDLTPFTPYMEKFGGYPLQRGKLLVDLSYDIAQRKLSASNHVIVAGLTLGAHNQSTEATHLPVKLGIALLKDRDGNIKLDVPLTGSLDDPQFRVMPLVWKVVVNILEKAATSPFTVLGAMFGGGGEELSYVAFAPGSADIAAPEQEKIVKLATALYDRPALQLEITATDDPATDSPALARLKLADQIRSLRAQELIAAGTPAESVQSVQVDRADYARLIAAMYLQTFGTNAPPVNTMDGTTFLPETSAGVPNIAAAPPAVPAEAHRARGIFKGGETMMQKPAPETSAHAPAPDATTDLSLTPLPGAFGAGAADGTTVATQNGEVTEGQMEAALAGRIPITADDLRALMVERGRNVQAALVKTGKVEGERMDILSPKPVNPTAKGEARANLSLD